MVVAAEVSLGGKGVSTTSDRPGPLASPLVALVVVVELVLEVEVPEEVTLGGKGVSTTSDGPGPLASPPVALVVVVELLVLEVEEAERRLGTGMCLPLIQVCDVAAACLALALACSPSLALFLSFSFCSFCSFSLAALSNSSLAFLIWRVCFASFLLISSWALRIGAAAEGGTGAVAVAVAVVAGVDTAPARTLPAWAEALACSSATR